MFSTTTSSVAIAAIFLLILPWALMSRPDRRPEIHGLLRPLWWLNALYCSLVHRLDSGGPAPLPEHGPAILIANHTCGIDHLVLQAGCQRVLGFMIAQEYFDHWLCRPFCRILKCIPVKRDGRDLTATRAALRALEEGRVLPIFPEGKILAKSGREFGEAKTGAAFIAMHAKVPVIPAYIRGTPETDDVFRAVGTPSQAKVVYGPPIDLVAEFGSGKADKEMLQAVTDRLMGAILDLKRATGPEAG